VLVLDDGERQPDRAPDEQRRIEGVRPVGRPARPVPAGLFVVSGEQDGHPSRLAGQRRLDRRELLRGRPGGGGRMRRDGRTEEPYRFGVTERAHDWSWNREGVCLYCAHCAVVNEILPIESLGAPMRVTEHPEDAREPCRWTIYKSPELVPDWAYERVGKQRPGAC
jgi:hypothetical protein